MGEYPVLRTAALISRFVGWLLVVMGAVAILWGISDIESFYNAAASQPQVDFFGRTIQPAESLLGLYAGIGKVVVSFVFAGFGIILILIGEIAQVFMDIEENTRTTAVRLATTTEGNAGLLRS